MKRVYGLFVVLFCSLCLLCGCGVMDLFTPPVSEPPAAIGAVSSEASVIVSESEEPSSVSDETSEVSVETSSEDTEEPSSEASSEEEDFFAANAIAALPEKTELPLPCTEVEPFLYAASMPLPGQISYDGYGYRMTQNGTYLALSYWDGEDIISVYSLSTGEKAYSVHMENAMISFVLWEDGSILCSIWDEVDSIKVVRMDGTDAEELLSLPMSYDIQTAFSEDGTYFAVLDCAGFFTSYNLKNKGQVRADLGFIRSEYLTLSSSGDGFLMGVDGQTFYIDPITAEYSRVYTDSFPMETCGGLYRVFLEQGLLLQDGKENGLQCWLPMDFWNETVLSVAFGWAATMQCDYETGIWELHLYDLRAQKTFDAIRFSSGCTFAFFDENGFLYLLIEDTDALRLYIVDLPAFAEGTSDGETASVLIYENGGFEAKLKETADEFYDTYGVLLRYGSEGNDFSVYGYVAEAELDPYVIYTAIFELRRILDKFPEGMIRETYELTNEGMQFYLCGRIFGVTGSGGVSEAGAVTTECDGYITIIFNVHNNLQADVPHELSHAFDRRIEFVGRQIGVDWMDRWYNECGAYRFVNSYDTYWKNEKYTVGYETSESRIWFIDAYSRTYPTEDRARIFEYLFQANGELPEELRHVHLKEKTAFYCEILRTCFSSCADGNAFWENALKT